METENSDKKPVSRIKLDRTKLRAAQSNLMLCAGIALGIEHAISGEVSPGDSFFANALNICAETDDELIKQLVKSLQTVINEGFEVETVKRDESQKGNTTTG